MVDRLSAWCLKATIAAIAALCIFLPYALADTIARLVAP